jgi:transcriptional regulator with XRE-family HTH domain
MDKGVSPDGAGLPMNGAAKASPPSVGIPDADQLQARFADPVFQRQQALELFAAKIGFAFKCARIRRGLTQEELAIKSGCSLALVRKLERGEYLESIRMIGRWAYELDVEIEFEIRPRPAIAIEAGTAMTEGHGPQDESAGRETASSESGLAGLGKGEDRG